MGKVQDTKERKKGFAFGKENYQLMFMKHTADILPKSLPVLRYTETCTLFLMTRI